jgi:hypothetical protein
MVLEVTQQKPIRGVSGSGALLATKRIEEN